MPDAARNGIFFLVQDQLDVFDRTTFARTSTTTVPGIGDLYYTRTDLVRFGDDGLAFRTETDLALLRLSRVNDDPCGGVPRCDPSTGQCTRQPSFDFAPCDDGDACTSGETCQGGVCRTDSRIDCNDNDPCTIDTCNATTGCTNTTVAGSCWGIAGRALASACAPQGCQTQRTNVSGVLLLGDDGTYTIPTTRICDATQAQFPDEKGTVSPGRKGWLNLRPGNVPEIIAALKACPSISKLARQIEIQTLRHARQRIMIPTTGGSFCRWSPALADGSHLCGIQRSGGSLVVRGVRVGFSIVARFGGERLDGGRVE